MSDDKIAEIRERHSRDERWRNSPSMISPQSHDDRATLLDLAERQRAENEKLREVLRSVRIDGPDFEGLVWVSFVSQGMVRAHVVVGDENRMASRVALRFKELRREALEGKP